MWLPFWRLRNASLHPALANDMAIPGGWIAGVASKLSFLLFPSTGPAAGCLSLVVVSLSPCLFCPVCLGACLDLGIGQVYSSEYCHPRAICGAETPDGSRHGEQGRCMIREVSAVVDLGGSRLGLVEYSQLKRPSVETWKREVRRAARSSIPRLEGYLQ